MSLTAVFREWLHRPDPVREAMAHNKEMTEKLCDTLERLDRDLSQLHTRPRAVYGRRHDDDTIPRRA